MLRYLLPFHIIVYWLCLIIFIYAINFQVFICTPYFRVSKLFCNWQIFYFDRILCTLYCHVLEDSTVYKCVYFVIIKKILWTRDEYIYLIVFFSNPITSIIGFRFNHYCVTTLACTVVRERKNPWKPTTRCRSVMELKIYRWWYPKTLLDKRFLRKIRFTNR